MYILIKFSTTTVYRVDGKIIWLNLHRCHTKVKQREREREKENKKEKKSE